MFVVSVICFFRRTFFRMIFYMNIQYLEIGITIEPQSLILMVEKFGIVEILAS